MKRISLLLVLVMLISILSVPSFAASFQSVQADIRSDISIMVDGTQSMFFNVNGQRVYPLMYQGTTYLPIRAIGEMMGKEVNWDNVTKTVSISSPRTSAMTVGTDAGNSVKRTVSAELRPDFVINIDGTARTFQNVNGGQVYPLLYAGSTYLPVRAIGEMTGKEVNWDNASKTVVIGQNAGTVVTDADNLHVEGTVKQPIPSEIQTGDIGVEKAKTIALNHAKLTTANVTFVKAAKDYDDGISVYEIEFYSQSKEYDYEINAVTGAIVSYDYDAEEYNYTAPDNGTSGDIGLEKAKSIALGKVTGASAANIVSAKKDFDDGRAVYEVKVIYGTTEYDIEIDATSGNVLDWDSESVYDD